MPRKSRPCDSIGDSGEDPVQLSEWRPSFLQPATQLLRSFRAKICFERVLQHKEPESHLNRGGKTASEEISWQKGVGWQVFLDIASG